MSLRISTNETSTNAAAIANPYVDQAIDNGVSVLLSHQVPSGYWWYTLEANETIGAEYIFLEHCLGTRVEGRWERIAKRMLKEQNDDGSWSLAHSITGDISATLECYVALRMTGYEAETPELIKARDFISENGGIASARVFTKIHFALLGLVNWKVAPSMPVEVILLPSWAPFSVYSFSSWARACIIPLLIILAKKPVWHHGISGLENELFFGDERQHAGRKRDIWADFFLWVDRIMKVTGPFTKRRPTKGLAARKAEEWIRAHIERTEDIFPALSYAALALASLGHSEFDPTITRCLKALQRFQHSYKSSELPAVPFVKKNESWEYENSRINADDDALHQQCCISPVWDTPWAMTALQASGLPADHESLVLAGEWLLTKQITDFVGDWSKKNPDGKPGGWSFEFLNEYFPDVDDTIQVLIAFKQTKLPKEKLALATERAFSWCLSMQNDDGGWAAFDKNNSLTFVNKIPFSDHGACLDPSSPDITGRMLQLLALHDIGLDNRAAMLALNYLRRTQETNGSWFGRWGANYIYGTWAVLTGLSEIGYAQTRPEIQKAADWLESVQNIDGGFGESVDSYPCWEFVPSESTASQTSWGLMGLIAAGRANSEAAIKAVNFLVKSQNDKGLWNELYYTGTGFPGHFYIRYHGYRHYFPVLALGKWRSNQA